MSPCSSEFFEVENIPKVDELYAKGGKGTEETEHAVRTLVVAADSTSTTYRSLERTKLIFVPSGLNWGTWV